MGLMTMGVAHGRFVPSFVISPAAVPVRWWGVRSWGGIGGLSTWGWNANY
jgi:hypothetical protein